MATTFASALSSVQSAATSLLKPITLALLLSVTSATVVQAATTSTTIIKDESKREDRKVSNFDKFEVGGAIEVRLRQGSDVAVAVEARAEVLPRVETRVSGGTLYINMTNTENSWFRNSGRVVVYVTVKDLKGFECTGASRVKGENTLKLDRIRMNCSGASSVLLDLTATTVAGEASGASSIKLNGNVAGLELEVSGASSAKLMGLEAKDVKIDASGASSVHVHALNTLNVDCSGASNVTYKGNPRITQDLSGASSLRASKD